MPWLFLIAAIVVIFGLPTLFKILGTMIMIMGMGVIALVILAIWLAS